MGGTDAVTVLFTDLVGSTELRSSLGVEAADELRRAHDRVLMDVVCSHGGKVIKGTGDGIMAGFDGAADALGAAVAIQQDIDRLSRRSAVSLSVRVGVSVGDVTWDDADCFGVPVIEASRLCAAAEGGQILTAELVRAMARGRGGYEFDPVGNLELKGLHDPVPALALSWCGIAAEEALPPALAASASGDFVGRAEELEALSSAWKHASERSFRTVMVAGESGIGKTRLAVELAHRVHDDGGVVLYGCCEEELGVPYQPFAEALRPYVAACPLDELVAHVETHGGELTRIVPELAQRLPDVPPPIEAEPEVERHRLFEAVAGLLVAASQRAPVLFVLDDLHWAAKPTLLLLRHLVCDRQPAAVLLMGTYRDTEWGRRRPDPLADTLAELRLQGVDRLALGGLDADAVASFVEAAAGKTLEGRAPALARALYAETNGNPFFIGEIVRHLAETGAIDQQDGHWAGQLTVGELDLPEGVREVIGQRLARLSEETNRTLSIASVIGQEFTLDLVAAVGDLDEERVLEAAEEALGARLLAERRGSVDSFVFSHALVRDVIYCGMAKSRKARLHRRAGEALEKLVGARPAGRITELAHHFLVAAPTGVAGKAVRYSIAAGDRAQNGLAPDEAARWYEQALELVDRLDQPNQDETRCEVLLRLGTAQRLAGVAAFRETLLDAAHLARRLGDTDRLVEAALTNTRGYPAFIGHLDVERIDVLRAALDAIGTSSPELRARLLAQWAIESAFSPEYDTGALINEALTLTETGDDPQARWHALHALYLYYVPQNIEERRARQAEYLDLASRVDPSLGYWINDLFNLAIQSGEIDQARGFLAENARLAQAIGDPAMRWADEWFRASLAILAGDITTGEHHANAALQIALDADQPNALMIYGAQLMQLRILEGREEEICDTIAQTAEYPGLPAFKAALASLLAATNRLDEARALIDELGADATALWIDPSWPTTLGLLAEAAAAIGHAAALRAIVPLLAPFADQWATTGPTNNGPIALMCAIARIALADYEQAETDLAQALAMAEHARAPYYVARTQLEWAAMQLERAREGDEERSRDLLTSALDIARERSFRRIENRCQALLDQLG